MSIHVKVLADLYWAGEISIAEAILRCLGKQEITDFLILMEEGEE